MGDIEELEDRRRVIRKAREQAIGDALQSKPGPDVPAETLSRAERVMWEIATGTEQVPAQSKGMLDEASAGSDARSLEEAERALFCGQREADCR